MKYLSLIGALIMFISCVYNAIQIFKGKTKPNLVSYVIWGLSPLIAFFASLSEGLTWSYLPTFMAGAGSVILFVCALLKKGSFFELKRYDILCGVVSVITLGIWYITKNPMIAIGLSIISDIMACMPTMIKTWKHPETESRLSMGWLCYCIMVWCVSN